MNLSSVFKSKTEPNPNPKPNPKLNSNLRVEIWQFLRHPFENRNAYINISKLVMDGVGLLIYK